jgi:hypothetical protein
MTAAEKRAYVLADNKLALNAGWDEELLALELKELMEADLSWRAWLPKSRGTPRTTGCRTLTEFRRDAGPAICGVSGRTGSSAATRSIRKSWSP